MKLILATILIFNCLFAFSQKIEAKSLLWKISGNGIKDTSYLYGTIHLIDKKNFVLTPQLKRSFKKTQALVLEVNIEMDAPTKQEMARKMMYPNRQSIKNYVSPSDYNYLHSYLIDTLKISALKTTIYEMMIPFFFESIVTAEQIDNVKSYEKTLAKMAGKKEKLFVETIQEQMEIVRGDSLELEIENLMKNMRAGKLNADKEMKEMIKLYVNQDLQELYNYVTTSFIELEKDPAKRDEMLAKMLTNRNKKWIPLLTNWMQEKSLFIAVGAGHLAGDEGVINLLKRQGYTVEPVFN
jgi:uncharacterized protein YbaP (TraB family)